MIFTSYTYIFFLAVVFALYWGIRPAWRKALLVCASYVFYCSWKWELGFLLLFVSLFNWSYARWVLPKAQTWIPLASGVLVNLAPLIYFKYTNFLVGNIVNLFGGKFEPFDILLPLGISFFTFQGIAYLVDVSAGEEPMSNVLDFLLFKGFWPQLIAGPIVRLDEIRGQLETRRTLAYPEFALGCQRILTGFFKKIVVADSLAPAVDMVFTSAATPNAVDAVAAILGFGLQIYFDFSAYSDIAIGSAHLFGFTLPENFNWPYSARSPQEFWARWHITLSRWIRDYVFTPILFATRDRPRLAPLCLLLAMAVCGLWHGARWTFVIWGIWHGLLLVANQTALKPLFTASRRAGASYPAWRGWLAAPITFGLVTLGWVFFRAQSVGQALTFLTSMATFRGGVRPGIMRENDVLLVALVLAALVGVQLGRALVARRGAFLGARLAWLPRVAAPVSYALACVLVIAFDREARAFVYFQF